MDRVGFACSVRIPLLGFDIWSIAIRLNDKPLGMIIWVIKDMILNGNQGLNRRDENEIPSNLNSMS
jgi:hypothetical protein